RRLRAAPAGTEAAATAELDAQLLLSHVMAVARARLKSHPEELADPSHTQHYRRLLGRRAAGEPLAYLTGSRDFWSLTLKVTPAGRVLRSAGEQPALRGAGRSGPRDCLPQARTATGAHARRRCARVPSYPGARRATAPCARGLAAARARRHPGRGCAA